MMAFALALALAAAAMIAYPGEEPDVIASETAAETAAETTSETAVQPPAGGPAGRPGPRPEPKEEPSPPQADRSAWGGNDGGAGGNDPRRSEPPRPASGGEDIRGDEERPNIVVVLTDDLDVRSMAYMPKVRSLLVERGTGFDNAFVTDPLCCPARSTFLRGQYSHNTGILGNSLPLGGHEKFRRLGLDRSTVAVWLDEAGYETFYAGKYLNGYADTRYVPPGWDRWFGWLGNYYSPKGRYRVNENGNIRGYDLDLVHDTDLLERESVEFLEEHEGAESPFFMYIAPNAPHKPAYVPRRHEGMFSRKPLPSPPSFNEANISDKPPWLRRQGRLSRDEERSVENLYRQRLASLQSVDEMVESLIHKLRETGQLKNTYIMFTSDNGFLFGEHRRTKKSLAYEESIRVPFIVRGPGVPGRRLGHLITNNDLAPTVADLAGIEVPGFVEGRSFAPLLERGDTKRVAWRTGFLVEHVNPTYQALRTQNYTYVEWKDGARELYDLADDPYQLRNLQKTASRGLLARLERRLERLKGCAREQCRSAEDGP